MWHLLDDGLADAGLPLAATRTFSPFLPFEGGWFVVAGDFHRPIGALAAGVLGAGDADAGGVAQQQVLAVLARIDPLAERLFEIIVAIGDVLRRRGRRATARCAR